jgi:hypothetical protein
MARWCRDIDTTSVSQGVASAGAAAADHLGVGELFEIAAQSGIPTVTIRGRVPDGAAYGPAAMALIEEALAAGDIVIAPAGPVTVAGHDRVGWWRIDPDTGATVDVMDDGTGTEGTEYQLPLTMEFRVASCVLALSGSILAAIVEILDWLDLVTARRGISMASIIFQAFSAARGWTGACK